MKTNYVAGELKSQVELKPSHQIALCRSVLANY